MRPASTAIPVVTPRSVGRSDVMFDKSRKILMKNSCLKLVAEERVVGSRYVWVDSESF
jgi:hypothetical protein